MSRSWDSFGHVQHAILEEKYDVLSNCLAQEKKNLVAQSHDAFMCRTMKCYFKNDKLLSIMALLYLNQIVMTLMIMVASNR